MKTGYFFDIKHFAIHDGPNIRTTVFFKGCPLRCFWCHNPEGIARRVQIVHVASRCIACQTCVQSCPAKALRVESHGLHRAADKCTFCLTCVSECPALAQEAVGWLANTDEIISEIQKDIPFYDTSGGGVTFSGGEPLAQHEILLEVLIACGKLGLHRAVDTTGYAEPEVVRKVAGHVDLFLYDIKQMDDDLHRRYTGVGNSLILDNLKMLAEMKRPIRIRIPLLAGMNDDEENVQAIAQFIAGLGPAIEGVDILPYHDHASGKYHKLGFHHRAEKSSRPDQASVLRSRKIFEHFGFSVQIGG